MTFTYDKVGNRQSVTRTNAAGAVFSTTSYLYDTLNRLTDIVNKNGSSAVVSSYHYGLRLDGKRYSVGESGSYTSNATTNYTYDDQGKLTGEAGPYATIAYTYDNVGNRLTRTVTNAATGNGTTLVNGATINTYDLNDRIATVNGSVTHTYDPDGNETTVNGQAAGYDFENHLVSLGSVASYVYDADGNRTSASNTGTTTSYVVDTSLAYASVVEEYSGASTTPSARYDYGDDLVRMDRGSGVYYYLYDGLGSTRQLVNASGGVTDSYGYSAFGVMASRTPSTGGTANPFLFDAQQFDGASGDYYLRARYYDQRNGRFISQDPYSGGDETPLSLHRYLYSIADPVDLSDPSGLDSLGEVLVTMAVNANLYKTQLTVAGIGSQVIFSFLYPDLAQDIALSMQAVPVVGAEEAATASVGRTARQAANGLDNYATVLTEELLGDEFQALNGQIQGFRDLALRVRGATGGQIGYKRNVALGHYAINGEEGGLIGISGDEAATVFGKKVQDIIAQLVGDLPNFNFSSLREFDPERKIIEQLTEKLKGQTDAVGDLVLYSERDPCSSCSRLISEFKVKFPRVNVHVITSNLSTEDIKAGK